MAITLSRNLWITVRSETGAVAADSFADPPTESDIPQTDRIYTGGAQGLNVYWSATGLGASDTIDIAIYTYNPVAGVYVAFDEIIKASIPPYRVRYFDLGQADQVAVSVVGASVPGAPTDLRIWATPAY